MSAMVRRGLVVVALLLVTTPAWAQTPPPNRLQGFSIVLVLGDVQEGGTSDNIPSAARAAIADLKDFLPYRSYRVLDTVWLLASSNEQTSTTRLRGADEQDYEVRLERTVVTPSMLQVQFAMSEPGGDGAQIADAAHRDAQLKREMMQLSFSRAALESQLKKTSDASEQKALRQRISEIEIALETRQRQARYTPGGATLIETTFTMSLDETVVVGTSRMRGGSKALIVLLTAATRGAKPRE